MTDANWWQYKWYFFYFQKINALEIEESLVRLKLEVKCRFMETHRDKGKTENHEWLRGYYTSGLTITVCKPIVYNTHARSFLFCRICMCYAYGVVGAHTLLCVLTPSLIKAENAAEEWGRLSEHLHLKTKTSWVSSSGDMSDLLNGGSTTGTRLKINTSGTQDSRFA